MYRLENTRFYQELQKRNTINSEYYLGFLLPITRDMNELLQYIRNQYPEFPDHGLQHSIRIIEYIGRILNEEQIDEFSDVEVFIFIISALFHDAGMVLYSDSEKDLIRANHHRYAKNVVNKYFDECIPNLKEKDRIKETVNFVCFSHGLALMDLLFDNRFNRVDRISYDQVRYKLLAFLIRIGDLMDLEEGRVNGFRMLMYSDNFSALAFDHNERHKKIKCYNYSSKEIEIEVEVENIQQYKIWKEWFTYLENDILSANTYLKETKINFPMPKTRIISANGDEFDIQELRFEIDEKGGIWEIISKSIYTNELDFVRELVQNAIDATLKKVYLDKEIELKNPSPRSWGMESNKEKISIIYSETRKKMFVVDAGIGMSKSDLQNFLFKVSSSGKVDCSNREFVFPGIAQYGIGFVSCLINANKIQIYTSEEGNSNIYHVIMESDSTIAFIQNIRNRVGHVGTVIELDLKQNFSKKTIVEYLMQTFKYTSVHIEFVNLDSVEEVVKNIWDINELEGTIKAPYLLSTLVSDVTKRIKRKQPSLNTEQAVLKKYFNEVNALNDFFKEEYYSFSNPKKLKSYNERVDDLKKNAPSKDIKENFPNIILDMEKLDDDEQVFLEVTSALDDYCLYIITEKAKVDKEIAKYMLDICTITSSDICVGQDWKYFVVLINSDFEVYDIVYSMKPIDIKGKTGIIFLKSQGCDYEHGIEFVAFNGFLFKEGEVFDRLARFSGYTKSPRARVTSPKFVVGLYGDYEDVTADVQEYFQEKYYSDSEFYNDFECNYAEDIQLNSAYDVIEIIENNFVRSNNKNVFKTKSFYDELYERTDDESYNLCDDLVASYQKSRTKLDEGLYELAERILKDRDAYFQDGICIPSRLNELFPLGVFRIVCNCTADARMKLNVTRHEASEIRSDVENWISSTGNRIQRMLVNSLRTMLEEEGLYCKFGELMRKEEGNGYFSLLSYKSLNNILKEYHLI